MPFTPDQPDPSGPTFYRRPSWILRWVFNRVVAACARRGTSLIGARLLEVRGRNSGQPRRTPVTAFEHDGLRYLISPRGRTDWVRNLSADDGRLALILGRHREELQAEEVTGELRPIVLGAYVRGLGSSARFFFHDLDAGSSPAELHRVAHRYPLYVLRGRNR